MYSGPQFVANQVPMTEAATGPLVTDPRSLGYGSSMAAIPSAQSNMHSVYQSYGNQMRWGFLSLSFFNVWCVTALTSFVPDTGGCRSLSYFTYWYLISLIGILFHRFISYFTDWHPISPIDILFHWFISYFTDWHPISPIDILFHWLASYFTDWYIISLISILFRQFISYFTDWHPISPIDILFHWLISYFTDWHPISLIDILFHWLISYFTKCFLFQPNSAIVRATSIIPLRRKQRLSAPGDSCCSGPALWSRRWGRARNPGPTRLRANAVISAKPVVSWTTDRPFISESCNAGKTSCNLW